MQFSSKGTLAILVLLSSMRAQAASPASAESSDVAVFPKNSLVLRFGWARAHFHEPFWGSLDYSGNLLHTEASFAHFGRRSSHEVDLLYQSGEVSTGVAASNSRADDTLFGLSYRFMHRLPCGDPRILACRLGLAWANRGSFRTHNQFDNNTVVFAASSTVDLAAHLYHDLLLRRRRMLRFSLRPQLSVFGIAGTQGYAQSLPEDGLRAVSWGRFLHLNSRLEVLCLWRRGNGVSLAYDYDFLTAELEAARSALHTHIVQAGMHFALGDG